MIFAIFGSKSLLCIFVFKYSVRTCRNLFNRSLYVILISYLFINSRILKVYFIFQAAEHLISFGADPVRCDLLGRTPLWMAARLGAPILLETLLKSPKAIGALNKPDKSGWTPIMVSANRNHQNPTIPKLLIAKGAKLKFTDKDGRYVSHIAAAAGDHIALAEIIKSAPDLAYVRDSRQCTPLHLAAERGQHACCSILLKTESAKKGNFCRSIIIFFPS